jgi:hypothetical protein
MAIFGALLLSTASALGSIIPKQNADAQAMSTTDLGSNMTSGNMTDSTGIAGRNITSSIDLMNIISQAIESKVNVSLSEAVTAAEGIGNNSRAVAAYLGEENGYLVYNVMVIDPSMNFSKVIVDPGNGHMLFIKQLSKEDMMKDKMERRHKMMSMMMGPEMMMGEDSI